jgi:hypothetical protein
VLGFAVTVAVIVGGVTMGPVADRPPVNRHMKPVMVGLACVVALTMVYFSLALPSCFNATTGLLPASFNVVYVLIIVASLLLGGMIPLMYELGAEMT